MKTVKLKQMELRNFKGVEKADYSFSDICNIRGGNATGKSTIYEAYLWCLFDKNSFGQSPKVQPLDRQNNVIHKLTTSVKLHITLDDTPMIIERSLKEEWVKSRGEREMVCKGTKSEYAINEVPMTKTQFNAKLTEIMPLEKWFMISSVGIIPSMEQKECRAALQDIAPSIDEREIAKQYPAVIDAMTKNISVEELQALTKSNRLKAKSELDGIPAAIDAQDRLRVVDDFDAIEYELNELTNSIQCKQKEIDDIKSARIDDEAIRKANDMRREIESLNSKIAEWEYNANVAYTTAVSKIKENQCRLQIEAEIIDARISARKNAATQRLKYIEENKAKIAELRQKWVEKNSDVYEEQAIETICHACGQELPADKVSVARERAYQNWNERKERELNYLQQLASECKQRIDVFIAENQIEEAKDKDDADRLAAICDEAKIEDEKLKNLKKPHEILRDDIEYQQAIANKDALMSNLGAASNKDEDNVDEEIERKKEEIKTMEAARDRLTTRLASREHNKRIEIERERLEKRERELADMIAEAEHIEKQITDYRKDKINAVERSVSSLFAMVRWKMYEQNVTNDGEKEICQAIINGVPYEQTNRAMQINAGIDIINAFSRAYGVKMPLFIDNAESVTSTLEGEGQTIKMTVVDGSELVITY